MKKFSLPKPKEYIRLNFYSTYDSDENGDTCINYLCKELLGKEINLDLGNKYGCKSFVFEIKEKECLSQAGHGIIERELSGYKYDPGFLYELILYLVEKEVLPRANFIIDVTY